MDRSDGPASSPQGPGTEPSLMRDDNTKGVQYDVFLSFRGDDTRLSFTSHLYSSLSNVGILVFKDDLGLPKGNSISPELRIAIESSTISIIIFSKNYASSRWCLNELSKIMELHRAQGRIVLPVFYDVRPSEVRNQFYGFGEAFRGLIQRSSTKEEEVSRWRTDLREVTNILGFKMRNSRNESEAIKNIVERVCEILDKKDLFVANHPIGVNSRMQDVIKMLESHPPNDVPLQQLRKQRMGGRGSKYDKAWYDVFLSFRSEDTRASFFAHLYSSLSNAGILVFKEDANHLKGLDITELRRAIECSTISIIIFSEYYAGSKWCLDDLSIIMELGRTQAEEVLPVFFNVDPSFVRKQTAGFGEGFKSLVTKISPTEVEVTRWRTDLYEAACLAGFHVPPSR
ncbi:hypothetical protein K1719_032881 [Acacia pycnantha]|nr:hypothetical protein K1719_032881 [Acacia pycnantha]